MKKNAETLIGASKEVGLEINTKKTKYMFAVILLECRSKLGHRNNKQIVSICVAVHIFGNDNKKSKFGSGGN
jgi:hypothetical protein